eukprot:TRINITY_DN19994_c0_g1_i1.p1 TRINITY_DN19994_c0_g1~~TRINITY_DN19994_c0_g1_i1.p1  ORF type:complete len:132 (-),score=17.63 TRINITY_DN19994_c0_g1_i1:74-469(-)
MEEDLEDKGQDCSDPIEECGDERLCEPCQDDNDSEKTEDAESPVSDLQFVLTKVLQNLIRQDSAFDFLGDMDFELVTAIDELWQEYLDGKKESSLSVLDFHLRCVQRLQLFGGDFSRLRNDLDAELLSHGS